MFKLIRSHKKLFVLYNKEKLSHSLYACLVENCLQKCFPKCLKSCPNNITHQSLIYELLFLYSEDGSEIPSRQLTHSPRLSPALSVIPITIVSLITVPIVVTPVCVRSTLGAFKTNKTKLISHNVKKEVLWQLQQATIQI